MVALLRRTAVGVFALFTLAFIAVPPAAAAPSPNAAPSTAPNAAPLSTDAILKWINDYRHRPDPDRLPLVVRALSEMQAFKDSES